MNLGVVGASHSGLQRRREAGLVAGLMLLSASAGAGEWTFTPRTASTLTLTDNLLLSQRNPQSDLVTQFTPGFLLQGEGARLNASANVALTRLIHLENSRFDRNLPQMDILGRAILLPQWLEAEAAFNRGVQMFAPAGAPMQMSLANVTGNVAEVSSFRAGPTLRRRFADLGELLLTYRYSVTEAQPGEPLPGTVPVGVGLSVTDNLWDGRFTTGDILPQLPLVFSHQLRESTFVDGGTDRLRTTSVQGSYPLTRQLRLNGTYGIDQNEFRNQGFGVIDGPFWQTGATWTPNQRLNFTFGYGRRFFGDNYSLDVSWTRRRFAFRAGYTEFASTFSSRQEDVRFVPTTDPFGNPIIDPLAGASPLVIFNRAGLIQDVAIQRRFLVDLRFDHRLDTLLVSLSSDQLESMTRNRQTNQAMRLANVIWRRQISPQASVGVSTLYMNSELLGLGREPNTMVSLGPDFSYRFSARLAANVNYRHTSSSGGGLGLLQFTENRLVGVLNYSFF